MQPVSVQPMVIIGKMAEWSIAAVLKTVDLHGSGGSNPSLSATRVLLCAVLFSFRMQQSLSFNSQTNQKQTSFSPPSPHLLPSFNPLATHLLPISYSYSTHLSPISHSSSTHSASRSLSYKTKRAKHHNASLFHCGLSRA